MIAVMLALLTVSVPVPEFVDLQRLPDKQIRTRFGLPDECDPLLTALADPPGRVLVVVTCEIGGRDAAGTGDEG